MILEFNQPSHVEYIRQNVDAFDLETLKAWCSVAYRSETGFAAVALFERDGEDVVVTLHASANYWATAEFLTAMCSLPFLYFETPTVCAAVMASNTASRSLIENLGGAQVGTREQANGSVQLLYVVSAASCPYFDKSFTW